MPSQSEAPYDGVFILAEVKVISGRRIEERRKFQRMTQKELAALVGMGMRWLREVEAGSPKSRIDDHMRCAHGLGLTASHLLFPMLFLEHHMHFPRQIFHGDMRALEKGCVEFIASFHLRPFLAGTQGNARDVGPIKSV